MQNMFGFTPDDLSANDLPARLHPELEAVPTSELTFSVMSTSLNGEYTVHHDGRNVTEDNCLAGVHESRCWHKERVQRVLERRAARLEAAQSAKPVQRDFLPLNGNRGFSVFR